MQVELAGQRVSVYTGGSAPGTRQHGLVFVHGAAHDHSVWNLQCRYFAHHGQAVFAPDLPGHGASTGAPLQSIEAAAEWLLRLLDQLDLVQARLVGHSMGSLIALEAAGRAPQRVSALALVGIAVPMPVAAPLLMAADGNRSMAHAMINSWSFSPRAQLGAGAIPGQVTTMVNQRLMERQAEGVLAHDLRACNAYQGGIAAAGQVRCPTLLVCGARDQMTPSRALAPLLDALAGTRQPTRVCMVPDCGHAIMAEAPDALTDALADFLTSI